MYKIFNKGNYIIIEDILRGEILQGLSKDVFVTKNNSGKDIYRIFNIKNYPQGLVISLGEILKKDSTSYTKVQWEDFYTTNTGNFKSDGASSQSIKSIESLSLNSEGKVVITYKDENDAIQTLTTPQSVLAIKYNVLNYSELLIQTPDTYDYAYVRTSQGTSWLPGGLGGNYYGSGLYMWDGVNWVEDDTEVFSQLDSLITNINSISDVANLARDAANTATTAANTARDAANVAADNINNRIQLNNRAAGNILRANGTVFESVPEVEFLRNINSYNRAPDSKFFDNKQLVAWDNFNRVNTNPVVITDSGHPYSLWRGTTRGEVLNSVYTGSGNFVESSSIFTIPNTKNIGIEFSMMRSTLGGQMTGIAIVKDDNNYIVFGRFFKNAGIGAGNVFSEIPLNVDYSLFVVINGISTTIGSISQQTMYAGGGNLDSFLGSRLNFIIKYGNRGRNGNSSVVVQSLDNPTLRIDVNITQFNSTFVTPADYNRIALISNYGDAGKIHSFKIANLDL
jgi:hypothetical protein